MIKYIILTVVGIILGIIYHNISKYRYFIKENGKIRIWGSCNLEAEINKFKEQGFKECNYLQYKLGVKIYNRMHKAL